ncbi:MAG: cytochrome c [Pseudomonadota bacterium]
MLPLLALLLACAPTPEPAAGLPPLPPALPAEARAGRVAFRERCQACHGLHAAGDGPAASALDPAPADLRGKLHDAPELVRRIRQGSDGSAMQPWRDKLEDEELEHIAAWLAGLAAPQEG